MDKEKCLGIGVLHIEVFGPDGKLKDERIVRNKIMDVGDAHVAKHMTGTSDPSIGWMAIGTNDNNDNTTQTTLGAEIDRNALTSRTQGVGGDDNDVIYIGDWAAGDGTSVGIKEAGLFNAAAVGTMLCRSVFTAIPKGGSDTLKITWTVTYGAS